MAKTFILRTEQHREALERYLEGWKAASEAEKPWQVEVQPEKAKRSLQANRLYWSLLQQVSEQVWIEGKQYSSEVFHELCKRRFIGCVDLPGGGLLGMSTTDLNTKEFAEYVDKVTAWAATEFGVTFTEPEPN